MEDIKLDDLIDKVSKRSDLKTNDIPTLDLYMDQIMTLFEDNLIDNKRYEDDKIMTKTMINNYSKAKVISPVKGKKYTKEQIIQMLLVYNLKNSLTIQEIKQILTPLYENKMNLEELYNRFIDIKTIQNNDFKELINDKISHYQLDIVDDRILVILSLISLSNQLNSLVSLMIDNYYVKEDK